MKKSVFLNCGIILLLILMWYSKSMYTLALGSLTVVIMLCRHVIAHEGESAEVSYLSY